MAFCLPKEASDKLLAAVRGGKIVPEEIAGMTSAERRALLEPIVGKENVREVNAQLESKLILKDQKRGMVNWVKSLTGISEKRRADLISKIERLDEVLDPADQAAFLEDLVGKKLGTQVSVEDAKTIVDLSRHLQEVRKEWEDGKGWSTPRAGYEYGATKVALQNFIDEVRLDNEKVTLKGIAKDFQENPIQSVRSGISELAGATKGIQSSMDNSAIFRQGWNTIFTHPEFWGKHAVQTFRDIATQLGRKPKNDEIINGVRAEILSRENAMNGNYDKMKLDIGMNEEAYPTSLPEKVPVLGRLYKASQVAYTSFLYRMRADIADKYVKMAENAGVDITAPEQLASIGKLTNSLTGRGSLGNFEKVGKEINSFFFSPKKIAGDLDVLTAHIRDPKFSKFARKQAAINLMRVVVGTAIIMATAQALLGKDAVELDPRSSDFGKIKVKDTRYDISGGKASMVVLAARLLPLLAGQKAYTKSSTTGKLTQINAKDKKGNPAFGARTGWDVALDFASNKASPLAGTFIDVMRDEQFGGGKPTPVNEAIKLFTPLPAQNAYETLNNPNAANPFLTILADGLGIAANTYSPKK